MRASSARRDTAKRMARDALAAGALAAAELVMFRGVMNVLSTALAAVINK